MTVPAGVHSRLTFERDRATARFTAYWDGRELVSGQETAVRLLLFRRGGLLDTLTAPPVSSPACLTSREP